MSSRVHYLAKYLKPAQLMTVVPLIGLSHYLLIPVVGSSGRLGHSVTPGHGRLRDAGNREQ